MATTDRSFESSKVGSRLREERERRGISLRELDRVNPSVSTLYALVTELGMTMSDVFGDAPRPAVDLAAPPRPQGDGPVQRPETRRVINLASGVRWERLTPDSDPDVEFLYVVYPVGAESCPEEALVTHGGREYGYVTSGTLGVRVGFEEYVLGPGASIAFDSSSPHRLWTIGDEPVHGVWLVIGRVADPRAPGAAPPAG